MNRVRRHPCACGARRQLQEFSRHARTPRQSGSSGSRCQNAPLAGQMDPHRFTPVREVPAEYLGFLCHRDSAKSERTVALLALFGRRALAASRSILVRKGHECFAQNDLRKVWRQGWRRARFFARGRVNDHRRRQRAYVCDKNYCCQVRFRAISFVHDRQITRRKVLKLGTSAAVSAAVSTLFQPRARTASAESER